MELLKFVLIFTSFTSTFCQLLVTLPNGKIQGHALKTFTNKTYYAYQGIPFATPPLGELRFQAPKPAQNWSGILNTTQDSSMCFQLGYDGPEESEDCLYINVFTPVLNRTINTRKLPVLFWIYGGGLRDGSARYNGTRPDYWMDEEVIMVTHNYRVGIFGFLSTGDNIIPGNNGLKDQLLALQWTFQNIHLFGGDNSKITIHGQSAGAVSASYHLLIKQSAGLFRSVIAESGSPMNMYSFMENPRKYALQLTQAINPNITTNASSLEIRNFLLGLEGKTIDSYSRAPQIVQPGVAIEPESPTSVVTKPMYEMFNSGEFTKVPILMGINSEECLFIAKSQNLVDLGKTYDKDSTLTLPAIFPHKPEIDKRTIGETIKQIYISKNDTWANHPGRVVRHFSDQRFARAIIMQGKLISKQAPVYFYQFSYDGILGGWDIMVEDAEKVQHGEEFRYIFLSKSLSEINESDALTHRRLIKLWGDFIKYGDPTPQPSELLQNITWPKVSPNHYQYLNINSSLTTEVNPKEDFFLKWEKIYTTYGKRPFYTF